MQLKERIQEEMKICNHMIAETEKRLRNTVDDLSRATNLSNSNPHKLSDLREYSAPLQCFVLELDHWTFVKNMLEEFLKEMDKNENQQ